MPTISISIIIITASSVMHSSFWHHSDSNDRTSETEERRRTKKKKKKNEKKQKEKETTTQVSLVFMYLAARFDTPRDPSADVEAPDESKTEKHETGAEGSMRLIVGSSSSQRAQYHFRKECKKPCNVTSVLCMTEV